MPANTAHVRVSRRADRRVYHPRMSKRGAGIVTAVIGAILAVIGLVVGLVPFQQIGEDCGSVFSGKSYGATSVASAFVDITCSNARAGRAGWTWALIIIGLIAVVVGVVLAAQRPAPQEEPVYRPSLRERMAERAQEDAAAAPEQRGVAGELASLAQLRDKGVLTAEEFEAAKQRILSGERQ